MEDDNDEPSNKHKKPKKSKKLRVLEKKGKELESVYSDVKKNMDLLMEAVSNDNREGSIKYSLEVGKCVVHAEQLKIELQQCQDEAEEEGLLKFEEKPPSLHKSNSNGDKKGNSSGEKLHIERLLNGKHKERKNTVDGTSIQSEEKRSKRRSLGLASNDKNLSYEGYCLSKKGSSSKWKKRYFLIDGTTIKWFNDQETSPKNKKPNGVVDLTKAQMTNKLPADKSNHTPNESPTRFFLADGNVQLVMEASDESDKNRWIKAIKNVMSSASLVQSVVKK